MARAVYALSRTLMGPGEGGPRARTGEVVTAAAPGMAGEGMLGWGGTGRGGTIAPFSVCHMHAGLPPCVRLGFLHTGAEPQGG